MTGTLKEQPREEPAKAEPTRQAPMFTPRFDIVETDEELTLYGDLPGVRQEQIDLRYEDEQLVIRGKVADRLEGITFLRQEYGVGDFYRAFTIGETIDAGKINAEMRNGVLTVHLPKTEAVKPRRIEVKAV
jgi:HSP20 family protein